MPKSNDALELEAHKQVLRFCHTLKWVHPDIHHIFTRGGCYQFYKILKIFFPQAECYYDGSHVFTKINQRYYDIDGENGFLLSTEEKLSPYPDKSEDAIKAEGWHKDSFWKHNNKPTQTT